MTDLDARFQEAINQGHSAAWDLNWGKAVAYYRQALNEKPDDIKALSSLALALFEIAEHQEALKIYLKVAEMSPNDPLPLEKAASLYEIMGQDRVGAETAFRAAELYFKVQDGEKAIENWSRAVGMYPEHLGAHSRLALVYERLGRHPQAVREYLHIASLMQHRGDIDKAVQAINRAIKLSPTSNESRQALEMLRDGVVLPKPARPKGGTGPIRLSSQYSLPAPKEQEDDTLDPIQAARKEALAILADLFFDQPAEEDRSDNGARRGLQNIVSGVGSGFSKKADQTRIILHLNQAVDMQLSGDMSQASEELKRAIEAGLDNRAAYFNLGLMRHQADRLESAIRYLQRSVQHSSFALASRLLLGSAYRKLDRLQEAAIEYLEALRLADAQSVPEQHADGLRQLYEPLIEAQAHEHDEKRNAQLCDIVADLLVRPAWRRHLKNMRAQLESALDSEGGLPTPLAEDLIEARSSQVVVAMTSVRKLAREGRYQAAMEEAFYALQYAPTYLPLHITMGELLVNADLLPEAIEKFSVVARAYSVRGEAGRAIDVLRRVVEMAPMDIDTRTRLIDQLIARGENEDAIKEYIRLAEMYYNLADLVNARKTYARGLRMAQVSDVDPIWKVRVLHRIADIDIQSLDWRQAVRIYQEIITMKSDDLKAYTNLVDLNFRLGEREEALQVLDKMIAYFNENKKPEEALKFLETQVEERPDQVFIRRRAAEQYRLLGQIEAAVEQLDAAAEMMLDAGDRVGALSALQRIIDWKPKDVARYQQLYDRLKAR